MLLNSGIKSITRTQMTLQPLHPTGWQNPARVLSDNAVNSIHKELRAFPHLNALKRGRSSGYEMALGKVKKEGKRSDNELQRSCVASRGGG